MNEKEVVEKLKSMINENRLEHSLGVRDTAIKLAKEYGTDVKKARWAGLLHDCAKSISNNHLLKKANEFGIVVDDICQRVPALLHAPVGAEIAKREFDITDKEILDAIRFHTLGSEAMTKLAKVLFLADYIEPNRSCSAIDKLRVKVKDKPLNDAVRIACESTIKYHLKEGELIHPQTIITRNHLL